MAPVMQSRTPFMDALVQTVTEYWTEQNVWLTPRETAIIRYVEKRLGTLHGREKIRNALKELTEASILTRTKMGSYEVLYAYSARYIWPCDAGYLIPWRTVLNEPALYVDEEGRCWAYGEPVVRDMPRLYRLPIVPRHFAEFLVWRARYYCRAAGFLPDHPEVELLIRRAAGLAALETARVLFDGIAPKSPTRLFLQGHLDLEPVLFPNPDPIAWRRRRWGKKRRRWRPEDDPWGYQRESLDVLDRLCGTWEIGRRAPYPPSRVFRELDGRLRAHLLDRFEESPPQVAELRPDGRRDQVAAWVERACRTGRAPNKHRRRDDGP